MPWHRIYLAELPLVQPNFEKGQAILHAWEVSGCARQELQMREHHRVTEDGVVVVWGWGLSGSCVGRQQHIGPNHKPQKRPAVNPPLHTGCSLWLNRAACVPPASGPTFFRGALLHEPGCPDIVLVGIEAAGFEETQGRTGMDSDSDHLLILACKHQGIDVQMEEMSENNLRKLGASPAWGKKKAPSQQSSAAVDIISEQRVTTSQSQQ